MNYDSIIIHYSEIGLKGANRPFFERRLMSNIKRVVGVSVKREYGRLVLPYVKPSLLRFIPGIAYYSPAVSASLDLKDIISKALSLNIKSPFRVSAKRSNKSFSLNSIEINRVVGEALVNNGLSVDLSKPRTELFIEVGERRAYLYTKKYRGVGGLPVGVTGKLVGLVSGGFDSPVACFRMIKRGCEVVIVHFFNESSGVKDKIIRLARVLARYQGSVSVYLVPFLNAQRSVIMRVPAKYRMIVYRRLMFLIANKLLSDEGAMGFVTGDNVAQVASQTLENLSVIWSAANANVYAPLIGYDKEEIISEAKRLGTYDISVIPYSDCCSYLVAKHPETKAELSVIKELESRLDLDGIINEAVSKCLRSVVKPD